MDKKMDKELLAKKKVAMELRDFARKLMGEKLMSDMDSMNKVTVAAPDAESLKEGLAMAEDVVEDIPGMPEMDEESTLEALEEELPAEEMVSDEDLILKDDEDEDAYDIDDSLILKDEEDEDEEEED